jgi:hypothetical protein
LFSCHCVVGCLLHHLVIVPCYFHLLSYLHHFSSLLCYVTLLRHIVVLLCYITLLSHLVISFCYNIVLPNLVTLFCYVPCYCTLLHCFVELFCHATLLLNLVMSFYCHTFLPHLKVVSTCCFALLGGFDVKPCWLRFFKPLLLDLTCYFALIIILCLDLLNYYFSPIFLCRSWSDELQAFIFKFDKTFTFKKKFKKREFLALHYFILWIICIAYFSLHFLSFFLCSLLMYWYMLGVVKGFLATRKKNCMLHICYTFALFYDA